MTLNEFFSENPMFAIAFSGGVDSSYLICAAKQAGVKVKGYYVKSAFQPYFEMEDAIRLMKEYELDVEVIEADVLSSEIVCENPTDRCYHCKKLIFSQIIEKAKADGFSIICDGTNASDDINDRPGMKALQEFGVVSPLRLCGITKADIRSASREMGIFTADKPAYACLATRIPSGQRINADVLKKVEACESGLFKLGFSDFRVRVSGNSARLQLASNDLPLFVQKQNEVSALLLDNFNDAVLDLKTIRGGNNG